jgi:hypothetical protein
MTVLVLLAAALWPAEPCERLQQSKLPPNTLFRIPPKQTLLADASPGPAGSQKVAQTLWGRGFLTTPNGKTSEVEFVCLLESAEKAVAVYFKPAEKPVPRLARR